MQLQEKTLALPNSCVIRANQTFELLDPEVAKHYFCWLFGEDSSDVNAVQEKLGYLVVLQFLDGGFDSNAVTQMTSWFRDQAQGKATFVQKEQDRDGTEQDMKDFVIAAAFGSGKAQVQNAFDLAIDTWSSLSKSPLSDAKEIRLVISPSLYSCTFFLDATSKRTPIVIGEDKESLPAKVARRLKDLPYSKY